MENIMKQENFSAIICIYIEFTTRNSLIKYFKRFHKLPAKSAPERQGRKLLSNFLENNHFYTLA